MNQALKQRLVGAAVLIALGIIFLPALFNGGRPHQTDFTRDIPPKPDLAPITLGEPKPVPALASEPKTAAPQLYSLAPKTADGEQAVLEKPAAHPTLDKQGLPNAWVLQVGVFSETTKANNLKKSLQAKGYKSFTRSSSQDHKTLVRVMIGPELDQGKLASLKAAVDKDFQVKSIVVKFEP
jgi:DedD protein